MSPKSRPAEGGGGKKGRKGKKGKSETATYRTVEESGMPFGIVVLLAILMTLPTLMGYFEGSQEFRPMIVRLLSALLVSWLLCQLVYSVIKSFPKKEETITRIETHEGAPGSLGDDPYGQGRAAS